ncbi:MAG: S26 family signal peptidase [Pirellulales bacterium]|nr:S26 family signal peptidase [Pirellulales bacterium]
MTRAIVELAIGAAIAATLTTTWLVVGYRVPSGSMAPAVLGVHRRVACADCGLPLAIGGGAEDQLPSLGARAICPNCGGATPIDDLPNCAGDRLIAWPSAYLLRPPRRWQMTLCRDPDDATRTLLKRVVGLPGETIELRGGDALVNGEIARKPLDVAQRLTALVHDSRYMAPGREAWRPDTSPSGWTIRAASWQFAPRRAASDFDWLSFVRPIDNTLSYNCGAPLVDKHAVDDWIVELDIASLRGDLAVELSSPRGALQIELLRQQQKVELISDGKLIASHSLAAVPRRMVAANIDRQAICELDGKLLIQQPIENKVQSDQAARIAIGARGGEVSLARVRIARDIHYLQPRGAVAAIYSLGKDEYLLLGDNPALSHDSRYWRRPGIAGDQLLGAPIWVFRRGE